MATTSSLIYQGIRKLRLPLSVGAIVCAGVWILLSESLPEPWNEPTFLNQLGDLLDQTSGLGLTAVVLLTVGIAGTIYIGLSSLILEPILWWLVQRWHTRCEVRQHLISSRFGPEHFQKNEDELALEISEERRFSLPKVGRWIADWFPSRTAFRQYYRDNVWKKPKWEWKIVNWASQILLNNTNLQLRSTTLNQLRVTLAENTDLRQLSFLLEEELEADPAAAFVSADSEHILRRVDAALMENNYRVAVAPALLFLTGSVAWSWEPWLVTASIPLILFYGSALAERQRISLESLNWLLTGNGTLRTLEDIRLWLNEEGRYYVSSNLKKEP